MSVTRDGGARGRSRMVLRPPELDAERVVPQSTIALNLDGDSDGISVRSFNRVLGEFTVALEEIDRIVDPERRRRPSWSVVDTQWRRGHGATIQLAPRLPRSHGLAVSDPRLSSRALWSGVTALATVPEVPSAFSARVVERISAVRAEITGGSGLERVSLSAPGAVDANPVEVSEDVGTNAMRAVKPASYAYGSVVGTLDVISARRQRRRVGLLVDHGPAILCNVGKLPEAAYFDAFERRVLVEGLLRRNSSGQAVQLDADRIEVLPEPRRVKARDLLGLWSHELDADESAVAWLGRVRGE